MVTTATKFSVASFGDSNPKKYLQFKTNSLVMFCFKNGFMIKPINFYNQLKIKRV